MVEAPAHTHAHAHAADAAGLTKNQRRVLATLSAADTPLSAYTILDRLRPEGFRAPLQVYRALEKLIAAGLVHRIESLNAFVACSAPACADHATVVFMLCEGCGGVDEFADDPIGQRLTDLCRTRHFRAEKRMVEVRGRCGDCLDV